MMLSFKEITTRFRGPHSLFLDNDGTNQGGDMLMGKKLACSSKGSGSAIDIQALKKLKCAYMAKALPREA